MSAEPRAVGDLVAAVRATIERRSLLKGGERMVLAVSGGPDSLSLLYAMHRLAPEYGLELHVAHFDHRLREGSGADAAFVARQAARLGLPATVRAADETEHVRGRSPEEAARERRLAFLAEVAESIGAARIATAHTVDDQAETVLMRVLQGTGSRGLRGIPAKRWWYIRPMIDVQRSQVEAFCRALRLRPRRDPTNDDPAFLRNLIRGQTLPMLAGTVNRRLPEALARLAETMWDEDVYLHGTMIERAQPELGDRESSVSLDVLSSLPVALQRRAVRYLCASQDLEASFEHTEAIRLLALHGESGRSIDLPGPLNAAVRYSSLVVGRAPSPPVPATVDLVIPGSTDLAPWSMLVRSWIGTERPAVWPDGRWTCVLDADRARFPLRVRRWRPGDRFRPLGMPRQKKVGDFFTDEKVARAQRAEVPVVVDAEGTVTWLVGHRIDDRSKVGPRTRRFLWLAAEGV